jgi:hypothetical protein
LQNIIKYKKQRDPTISTNNLPQTLSKTIASSKLSCQSIAQAAKLDGFSTGCHQTDWLGQQMGCAVG